MDISDTITESCIAVMILGRQAAVARARLAPRFAQRFISVGQKVPSVKLKAVVGNEAMEISTDEVRDIEARDSYQEAVGVTSRPHTVLQKKGGSGGNAGRIQSHLQREARSRLPRGRREVQR
jgi:hypothetical protein